MTASGDDEQPVEPPSADPPASGAGPRRPTSVLVAAGAAIVLVLLVALVVTRTTDEAEPWTLREEAWGELVSLGDYRRLPLASGRIDEPKRRWSVSADLLDGAVVAIGSRSFFAIETREGQLSLVARALSDGKEQWSEGLTGNDGYLLPDLQTMFLDGDALVLQLVASDLDKVELRTYDQEDGELNWRTEVDPGLLDVTRQGDVLLGHADGNLVAYGADDGGQLWSAPATARVFAVTADRIHLADGRAVRALALADGAEQWVVELSGDVVSLVVAGDRVVASAVDEVVALTTDGAEAWRADLDTGAGASLNTVQGSTVVAVGPSGAIVVAVDATSGRVMTDDDFHVDEELWRGSGYRMPGGDIVMFGTDGSVDLMDGASGRRLGGVGDEFTAISRSMLFAQDADEVTAFGLDDLEEERWSIEVDATARILPGPGLVLVQDEDGYELWS